MSAENILGFAVREVGQKLEPFEYDSPILGDNDVRISVTHCGVCHTDIHAIENYYNITTYPFVPGHEIVGHVTEVGKTVIDLKEGDRVGIGWQARSCGHCEWCIKGETQLCMKIEENTVMVPYGGFSSSVIADHRFVYALPPKLKSESASVLMCAGLTVYNALRKFTSRSHLKLAVYGVGGLGHLGLQFAKAFGFEITAVSSSSDKKEQALDFGADHFIDVNDISSMVAIQYSYDLILCTASRVTDWERLLSTLKKRGELVLLGFPDLSFNSTDLVAHDLMITGSLIGNPPIMREMLTFAVDHGITPMVELMPMCRVNEALQRVKENKARYRIVLVNDLR